MGIEYFDLSSIEYFEGGLIPDLDPGAVQTVQVDQLINMFLLYELKSK